MKQYILRRVINDNEIKEIYTDKNVLFYRQYKPSENIWLWKTPDLRECVLRRNYIFETFKEWYDVCEWQTENLVEIPENLCFSFSIDNILELNWYKETYPKSYECYKEIFKDWSEKEIDISKSLYRSSYFAGGVAEGWFNSKRIEPKVPIFIKFNNYTIKAYLQVIDKFTTCSILYPWTISYDKSKIKYSELPSFDDELYAEIGGFENSITEYFKKKILNWED